MRYLFSALLCGLLATSGPAGAQTHSPAAPQEQHFKIATNQSWIDTGIDVHPGEVVRVSAQAGEGKTACDPTGVSAGYARNLPLDTALPGALLVRLQADAAPVAVGTSQELKVDKSGRLSLGVNVAGKPSCAGTYAVTVQVTAAASPTVQQKLANAAQTWLSGQFGSSTSKPAGSSAAESSSSPALAPAAKPLTVSSQPLDADLRKQIDGLPRRVNDQFNNLGDMVNFVLVGNQSAVQAALETANWNLADRDIKNAAIAAAIETYQNKDYVRMPMSDLLLFGRVQDFGYEQAEAYAVVASRHHFRIWKAPFQCQGKEVWVGAGTHDIGFEKDQRNGKVTHKIDPLVDGERDHIGASLQDTHKVQSMYYYLPPEPVQDARNATGGGYQSDGRILVLFLE
jgi:hypothetical protein